MDFLHLPSISQGVRTGCNLFSSLTHTETKNITHLTSDKRKKVRESQRIQLPLLATKPLGEISGNYFQSKDAGWRIWKFRKGNSLFLFFVNRNGYAKDDKYPKILGLSHWQKNHFLRLIKQILIFGKFLPKGY